MVGASLQVFLLYYLAPLMPFLSLVDFVFNLPCTVAEGSKTIRFRGHQGHKISLAVSDSSSFPAYLSGKRSSYCTNKDNYIDGLELFDNHEKSSAGICTSLLDVSVASASGMNIWLFACKQLWEVCCQP